MSDETDQPWLNAELPAEQRAALLLDAMTLEEKADLMTGDILVGVEGFSAAGIDRLGIPPLRMADAGSGLRRSTGSTAPSPARTTGCRTSCSATRSALPAS